MFEALLEELRHRGEGVDLDYKAERYRFVEATDVEKSEMLKDILALANTDREGSAYIVLGFKENKPNPAKVVGIATSEEVDDAHIQQFVNSKLGRKLKFSYQEVLHQGKLIGLVTIPRQKRPFYVNKKFGKVQADTVYIRRGTSTSVASLEEIADMGLEDVSRGPAQFTLSFLNGSYELLDSNIECTFVRFPAGLDDFPLRDGMVPGFSSRFSENPEYWRKAAEYISLVQKAIPIRFSLTNRSAYSISEVCVELVCCDPSGKSVSLRPEGEMPNMPEKSTFDTVLASELVFPSDCIDVRSIGSEIVARCNVGTVRPGETYRLDEELVLLPQIPGLYLLRAKTMGSEFPEPIITEETFRVRGETIELTVAEAYDYIESVADSSEF